GNLRFARQRLRFRAHLGETRALAFDLAARAGELRLDFRGRRQRFERALRLVAPGGRFVAVRRQSRRRLAQRREARRVAAPPPPRPRPVLPPRPPLPAPPPPAPAAPPPRAPPPRRARRGLGLGGGGALGLARRHRLLLGLDLAPRGFELGFDVGEAVLAGQTAGRAGRRIGGDREAVPAPEVALARDQALAGLEHRCEARGLFALDHSDLRPASRPLFWRLS